MEQMHTQVLLNSPLATFLLLLTRKKAANRPFNKTCVRICSIDASYISLHVQQTYLVIQGSLLYQ